MDKTDTQTSSINEAILSSSAKPAKKKSRVGLAAFVVILIILAGTCFTVFQYNQYKKHEINQSKISGFFNTNSCSEKDLQSVSSEKPSTKHMTASINLLTFRASCLNRLGQYNQSITAYEQLKTYYGLQHNAEMISVVNGDISGVKLNINYYASHRTGNN